MVEEKVTLGPHKNMRDYFTHLSICCDDDMLPFFLLPFGFEVCSVDYMVVYLVRWFIWFIARFQWVCLSFDFVVMVGSAGGDGVIVGCLGGGELVG